MIGWSGMIERGKVFYYRRGIPLPLRPILGKREFLVSLKTKDREVAKRLLNRVALEVSAELQAAKRKLALLSPEKMAERWKAEMLAEDLDVRANALQRTEADVRLEEEVLSDAIIETEAAVTEHDTSLVDAVVRDLLAEQHVTLDDATTRKLAKALLRARLDALHIARKRASGDTTSELPVSVKSESRSSVKTNPPLSLVLDSWLSERQPPSKTVHEVRATFKRFQAVCAGEDRPIKDVTKADVRAFRESLLNGDSKTGQGRGKLATATVKKYLGLLATVFSWAAKTGLIEVSPVNGAAFIAGDKRQQDAQKRQPFTEADLRVLFGSPLYTGAKSKARRSEPGEVVEQDALWWTFPLGLYSGMRLEEYMGLRVQDVRDVEGVLCFDLKSRADRTLKTASSKRIVPVHDALKRLGLVEWRDAQPKDGLLFPELRPDAKHGKLTAALSKQANRYLRGIGIEPPVVAYSTRHSFADALRRAKVEPEIRSRLLGHSVEGMSGKYGAGFDVHALAEAVNSVRYEGISIASAR